MEIHETMVVMVAQLVRQRFYSAKLEGKSDVAAFEELVRIVLETYEEARSK